VIALGATAVGLALLLSSSSPPATSGQGAASGSSSAHAAPDPRAVDVRTLLPSGEAPQTVLYGDLDGSPPEEIAVLAAGPKPSYSDVPLPQLDLKVFSWRGGAWNGILDASAFPEGDPILSLQQGTGQEVGLFKLVDFQQDGSPQLVVAVTRVGGSAESTDLWVLSDEAGTATDLHLSGLHGSVSVDAQQVLVTDQPYCGASPFCPGFRLTEVIGASGPAVDVLSTRREAVPATTAEEAAQGLLYAWQTNHKDVAATVATSRAIRSLFADSWSPEYVFGTCSPAGGEFICGYNRGSQPWFTLDVAPTGGAYEVQWVAPPSNGGD